MPSKLSPRHSVLSPRRLRVARIPFSNTAPFFSDRKAWEGTRLLALSPRELGRLAAEGKADAGLLSLVDLWRLGEFFEPLGDYGVAVKKKAHSVLLFSKKRLEDLAGANIGVTDQTSTSVVLLKIILQSRYGLEARFQPRFKPTDDARLLIGDDALKAAHGGVKGFPHSFDLGGEWHQWRQLPFVFARWAVRRTAPAFLKDELAAALEWSLRHFEKNGDAVVRAEARRLGLPVAYLSDYLGSFRYRLGEADSVAETAFRDLVTGNVPGCGC